MTISAACITLCSSGVEANLCTLLIGDFVLRLSLSGLKQFKSLLCAGLITLRLLPLVNPNISRDNSYRHLLSDAGLLPCPTMKLRIACVQYDSRIGQVERNIQHVDRLLTALRPEDVDILLLPEMAFTGYVFASKDEVDPLVEDAKGPTVTWAAGVAQKLRCHVQVGFPERDHASGAFYNSAAIVTPGGAVQVGTNGSQMRSCDT